MIKAFAFRHSSAASADSSTLRRRSTSGQLDVVATTPAPSSSPSAPSVRRLDSLATNHGGKRRLEAGFTLLEMVVAVGIFALMSAMAYGGLNSALNTREHADAQADRLAQLQKAMLIIGRDIEQAIDRPVRDNYADELPAMKGGGYGSSVLEFSRTGRSNPMGQQRSHLQRVGYVVMEDQLLRQIWPVVDRSLDSEPFEAVMLEGVAGVDLRFMDNDMAWQTQWPLDNLGLSPNQTPPAMPRAVEITLDLDDWGRVRRIFEVVGS